ncbi:hypothetical protein MSM1_05920 [Mycobacterium sp. SM1]|uniref:hypothetical protein n=1 Tax=Mycobacterium sp. SM1 TaxID=2816243 RepID=UPI001BD125BF|nr:hypothetical protein [Mycobacterium sp. SM1]MBS4727903.1 hypothetical protein [Mycobacterium sp. SM1]
MLAKVIQVTAIGIAVAGLGWVAVVGPDAARAQPARAPQDVNFSCPDIAGINYVADPDNSNAYDLCVDGVPQHHYECPPVTKLVLTTPPKCMPWGAHHMP